MPLPTPSDRQRAAKPPSKSQGCCISRFLRIVLPGLLALGASCRGPDLSPSIEKAHRLMQQGKMQKAIDALKDEQSGEGRYLKSAALYQLEMPEAARDEIEQALKAEPENVKYRALKLALQMFDGEAQAAERLIQLHEDHAGAPVPALFAFYAHQRRARSRTQQESAPSDEETSSGTKNSAQSRQQAAKQALRTAIALSAQVPEFQRRLLDLALFFQLGEPAVSLIEKLQQAAPEDEKLRRKRITALLQAKENQRAIEAARDYYQETDGSERAAMVYATALAQSKATDSRNRAFAELVQRYPVNSSIVTMYAVSLVRSHQFNRVVDVLETAIDNQTKSGAKHHLMRIAISLPLEEGAANLAERQLNRYRGQLNDPLLVTYFEGRLLYLQNRPEAALDKLAEVVKAQSKASTDRRRLADEALMWMKRITGDQLVSDKLQQAAEAVQKNESNSQ